MRIKDKIYGSFKIEEPVLLALLKSPTLKRLKGINNGGWYPAEKSVKNSPSRYEHSIGVFLLLRRYGAPLEEQIAGLLHDASHSAFSHTIDYIVSQTETDMAEQGHQDKVHADFLENSEIKSILEKYGFSLKEITDEKKYPLLEQPLPALCADRIDYFLRTFPQMYSYKIAQKRWAYFLEHLIVADGVFAFDNPDVALFFAKLFNWTDEHFWSSFVSAVMFGYGGLMFKKVLSKGYLKEEDFYTFSDKDIIKKVKKIKDEEIKVYLKALNEKAVLHQGKDIPVICKVRSIDPLIATNGVKTQVSKLFPEYARQLKQRGKTKKHLLKSVE